jgi:hypothetical protein
MIVRDSRGFISQTTGGRTDNLKNALRGNLYLAVGLLLMRTDDPEAVVMDNEGKNVYGSRRTIGFLLDEHAEHMSKIHRMLDDMESGR